MDEHRQSLIPLLITEQLERAANLALDYAPVTRMQLGKLRGKSFALELQRPHFPLLMEVSKRHVHFQSQWEGQVDVTVRGPAVALLKQINSNDQTPGAFMAQGIEIEGDQELAQHFMAILKDLDLDLESALGDLIGDMAAHQISEVARMGFGFLRNTAKAFLDQSRHLVVEERKLVVKRREFMRFEDDVSELRQDTERLQARLNKLKNQLPNQDEVTP